MNNDINNNSTCVNGALGALPSTGVHLHLWDTHHTFTHSTLTLALSSLINTEQRCRHRLPHCKISIRKNTKSPYYEQFQWPKSGQCAQQPSLHTQYL